MNTWILLGGILTVALVVVVGFTLITEASRFQSVNFSDFIGRLKKPMSVVVSTSTTLQQTTTTAPTTTTTTTTIAPTSTTMPATTTTREATTTTTTSSTTTTITYPKVKYKTISPSMKQCFSASDCTIVQTSCCTCQFDGQMDAINVAYAETWITNLNCDSVRVYCRPEPKKCDWTPKCLPKYSDGNYVGHFCVKSIQ